MAVTTNQMLFLWKVNTNLKEAIRLAAIDYTTANELFRHYHAQRNSTLAITNDELMSSLQYIDVFTQRIEHLIATHHHMIDNGLALKFEESFYHLHVFQAMTIELDLLKSMGSLQELATEFSNPVTAAPGAAICTEFVHTAELKETLRTTISDLLDAGGEKIHLPIPALGVDQVRVLNSLYTMESERVVLKWFLSSMPGGTWAELIQHYEQEIGQVSDGSMELF